MTCLHFNPFVTSGITGPTYKESFQVRWDHSIPLFLHAAIYLEGRWQHGDKVGYCYPSGLEKTLCKWDVYVPLVTVGLNTEVSQTLKIQAAGSDERSVHHYQST
jgi:hypothetical protein